MRISLQEPLGAEDGRELGAEDLERHGAVVAQVARAVDGGHAAGADLALHLVAAAQRALELLRRAHRRLIGAGRRLGPAVAVCAAGRPRVGGVERREGGGADGQPTPGRRANLRPGPGLGNTRRRRAPTRARASRARSDAVCECASARTGVRRADPQLAISLVLRRIADVVAVVFDRRNRRNRRGHPIWSCMPSVPSVPSVEDARAERELL